MGEISYDILLGAFLNMLEDEIWSKVKLFGSRNLIEVMDRAQRVEKKNWIIENQLG